MLFWMRSKTFMSKINLQRGKLTVENRKSREKKQLVLVVYVSSLWEYGKTLPFTFTNSRPCTHTHTCCHISRNISLAYIVLYRIFGIRWHHHHHLNRSVTISVPVAMASPSRPYPQSSCAETFCTVCCTMISINVKTCVIFFADIVVYIVCLLCWLRVCHSCY